MTLHHPGEDKRGVNYPPPGDKSKRMVLVAHKNHRDIVKRLVRTVDHLRNVIGMSTVAPMDCRAIVGEDVRLLRPERGST